MLSAFNLLLILAVGNLPSLSAQDFEKGEKKAKDAADQHGNDRQQLGSGNKFGSNGNQPLSNEDQLGNNGNGNQVGSHGAQMGNNRNQY